ncbi:MAG: class I SAM-dependent methyltransferase family protein, partial [Nanoarchaeota archaeon]
MKVPRAYDVIGSIAILKFPEKTGKKEKKKTACKLLEERKNIKTVLEKTEKVKGRLRTIKTRYLAGLKSRETIHKESSCLFKLDVEKCYFSPRLSGERLEIAKEIRKKDKVLVMFSGVGPYPIVIGKISGCKKVVSIELSRIASKYAKENVKLNKLKNVEIVQGDVKRLAEKLGSL